MILKDAVRKVLAAMPEGMALDPIIRFERHPSRVSEFNRNEVLERGGIFSIQFFAKEVAMLKRVPPASDVECRINVATFIPDINEQAMFYGASGAGHKLPNGQQFGRYWGVELPAETENVDYMIDAILAEKNDGQ